MEQVIVVTPGSKENGALTQRRLIRLQGLHAHARAVAWMDGYAAGRAPGTSIVSQARVKRKPRGL